MRKSREVDSHSSCSSSTTATVAASTQGGATASSTGVAIPKVAGKSGLPHFSLRNLLLGSPFANRRRSRHSSGTSQGMRFGAQDSLRYSESSSQESGSVACSQETASCRDLLHGTSRQSVTVMEPTKEELGSVVECPLCLAELNRSYFPELINCSHRACYECLRYYLRIEISESRVNICCPQCPETMHPNDMVMILNNPSLIEKYEDFMVRRVLVTDPDTRWCPAPDCGYAVIASGCASCPKIRCERPGCGSFFCYHCKAEWHPNQTCDAARAQRSPDVRSSSISFRRGFQQSSRDDIKTCPRCQMLIVKMDDGSCNHMTCAVCGAEFCWLCMKEISDLHYLSPSGCTFWGKKPWSRKKKILWQLGTLVGAPVGIGLVAGIAVPAIIIGVPVWVGRKLYARYRLADKHRRNLVITGGVTAAVLVSPLLAGLAVVIGVPILLAYVYGVVPISLCRSGGCGVSTSASGVRFDFDDETDVIVGLGSRNTDGVSDAASQHGVNPSIGEVSFGPSASLSMGSGSNLDRLGRESDRESASNVALAGTSIAGSIASSNLVASSHKLEVQADIASTKRFSLSSETASATVSLSERSATMSLADDGAASTRALAGSVLSYKMEENSSVSAHKLAAAAAVLSESYAPVEVHIDGVSQKSEEATLAPCSPISSFSADELLAGNRRSGRRRLAVDRQVSENSSLMSTEDTTSERVRFDDNVSFIDSLPGEERSETTPTPASLSTAQNPQEAQQVDLGTTATTISSTVTPSGQEIGQELSSSTPHLPSSSAASTSSLGKGRKEGGKKGRKVEAGSGAEASKHHGSFSLLNGFSWRKGMGGGGRRAAKAALDQDAASGLQEVLCIKGYPSKDEGCVVVSIGEVGRPFGKLPAMQGRKMAVPPAGRKSGSTSHKATISGGGGGSSCS